MNVTDADFDDDWVLAVRAICDPVFDSADVNFLVQVIRQPGGISAILWEAEPERFASRYPDSHVVEAYGSGWPPPCIDFWAYVDTVQRRARLCPEGWGPDDITVDLVGDGVRDGVAIARQFASVLRVPGPPDP